MSSGRVEAVAHISQYADAGEIETRRETTSLVSIDVYNVIRVLFYNVFSGTNNTYNAY